MLIQVEGEEGRGRLLVAGSRRMKRTKRVLVPAVGGLLLAYEVTALDELAMGGELGGGSLPIQGTAGVV